MEKRSALNFTIRIKASLFHLFAQDLVNRAYQLGYEAAKNGRPLDLDSVLIDPSQVRKLHP